MDETLFNNGTADDQMDVAPLGGRRASVPPHRRQHHDRHRGEHGAPEHQRVLRCGHARQCRRHDDPDDGPGNDTITTGDGADVIQGGTGVDTLNGGNGGDRILGNPGNDVMNGNAGDDTLVWNNGDGNDQMNGNDGLDRIEDNLGAANDVSALSARVGGKLHYARTNNPFTLDIATSELFELNTFGGDDTLTTVPGLGALIAVVADAGSGNDAFTGGDESDTYFGGLGDDWLDPGPGIGDAVDGQDGNDTLKVRDGAADLARGGAGMDNATADREDILVDVETQDVTAAPPAPDTQGTAARVLNRRITSKLKKGVYTAKIRVECPASETGGCAKGILALQTARKISLGGTRFNALVAVKRYTLDPGSARPSRSSCPGASARSAAAARCP